MRRYLLPTLPLLFLLALFLAGQSVRLDQAPPLNPDEAAYTEPAWTWLTSGRFGAPMYAGLLAIDQRWYFLWPGYAVLAVFPYATLGVNVLAVRLLSAGFGAVLLVAVWLLAWEVRRSRYPAGVRATIAVAATAAALTLAHPTVLFLSRFGRPEVAVTALAVVSSALAARAARWQAPGWAAAAGAAATLAFLMHQYGGLALAALGAAYLLRSPKGWGRVWPQALAAAAGAAAAALPWVLWIASDWPEFRAQLGVQLEYQRWRYEDASVLTSLARDLPGRYLLNRQDYPPGWQPWSEAMALLLGPRFFQGPAGWDPLALLKWGASVPLFWQQVGIGGLYRWGVLGALLVALAISPLALRCDRYALRWVLLPLVVWAAGLTAIPNKWEGYTGPVAAYAVAAVALFLGADGPARQGRRPVAVATALCACLWLAADVRLLTQPAGAPDQFAHRLRQAVPVGAPVAIAMREWFVFAGRNPAVTYEFRSVPAFHTSVLEMLARQRPRYLVLQRTENPTDRGQRYHFISPPWDDLYAYVDGQTDLVATVHDAAFGTVEVRRIREYPELP